MESFISCMRIYHFIRCLLVANAHRKLFPMHERIYVDCNCNYEGPGIVPGYVIAWDFAIRLEILAYRHPSTAGLYFLVGVRS